MEIPGTDTTIEKKRLRQQRQQDGIKHVWEIVGLLSHSRLFSALLFLTGLVLIVHALAYASDSLAPDGNTRFLQADRKHMNRILQTAGKLDALAIGNSHTGALDMGVLGFKNGYKFPRADGDLFETRLYLEQLIPRLPRADTILIPISYFSFLSDNTASDEVKIRRAHMYASLPSWKFLEGDVFNLLIGKSHAYFPVLRLVREDHWEAVFYTLSGDPPEEKGFIEVEAGDCSFLTEEQIKASVENRVAKYMRLTQAMQAQRPDLAEENYANLVAIHKLLKEEDRRLVFFTPPYLKAYHDYYQAQDPETIALMRASMERLQQEYGVEYYDFSRDSQFSINPALFKDSDHLNACGMAEFSAKFREVLEMGEW